MPPTARESRPRILLVEDDQGQRSTLEAILDEDYEVFSFAEPVVAFAAVEHGLEFELALVDQRMPLMTGTELLTRLRSRDARPMRLVLSGAADAGDLRAAINEGQVYRFLLKPYDPQELLNVVGEALERHALERDRDRLISELRVANDKLLELTRSLEVKVAERTLALDTANRELATLARTDELTGLPNRRQLEEVLERDIQRAQRFNHPLSLMIVDVDNFKQVNDLHGHLAGDDLLKDVASRLRQSVRKVDLVARWGGDEFVVVVSETPLSDALITAERLRAAVAPLASVWGVTLSIGVAGWTDPQTIEDLITSADAHLYRAKAAGRDRVAGPEPAP